MMNKVMSILAVSALAVAPALFGQAPQGDQPKQDQQQADRVTEETMTGCLTESQGTFTLATDSGDKVNVSASADLNKHKDHTVKLTGRKSDEGGKTVLNVTKIEMVSASCPAK